MVVGIEGVFPDLVLDAVRPGAANPEVAAADRIVHAADDPGQRGQQAVAHGDRSPQAVGEPLVQDLSALSAAVRAEQVDPLRRGIHRAVVREVPVRRRARVIRATELVQDAARLLFAARVVAHALQPRQVEQRGAADPWEVVQQVVGHAQRVATEQAVKQAVGTCRGEHRPVGAELAEAVDATKITERLR